jgi:hypothetical protein
VAKSKKERRSSIRHMAADDAYSVLEALERAEQQTQPEAAAEPAEADPDEGVREAGAGS